jgi:hypothetical protein
VIIQWIGPICADSAILADLQNAGRFDVPGCRDGNLTSNRTMVRQAGVAPMLD